MTTIPEDVLRRWDSGMAELSRLLPVVDDEFFSKNLELSMQMLSSEASSALHSPNPRSIKGLAFTLNDFIGMTADLSPDIRAKFEPAFDALRSEMAALQTGFSLPETTAAKLRSLRTKLSERRAAREKQLYLPPGSPLSPLPHEPATLQQEASLLQQEIAAAGFQSPSLERLSANPATFELRDVSELIDEINAVLE